MTEEVTPTDTTKPELYFLDMTPDQFGTIVFLSSVTQQMGQHVNSEKMVAEMQRMIDSGNYQTVQAALAWIRGQRNLILSLNGATGFALNLLGQVEDLVVDQLLDTVCDQDTNTEETK